MSIALLCNKADSKHVGAMVHHCEEDADKLCTQMLPQCSVHVSMLYGDTGTTSEHWE